MTSAATFRKYRLRLGLTQKELAAHLAHFPQFLPHGLKPRQIRNLEAGRCPVEANHMAAIKALMAEIAPTTGD